MVMADTSSSWEVQRSGTMAAAVGAHAAGARVHSRCSGTSWFWVRWRRVVNWAMRLEPLYRMVFEYPEGWSVDVGAGTPESQHLFLADGHCDGPGFEGCSAV